MSPTLLPLKRRLCQVSLLLLLTRPLECGVIQTMPRPKIPGAPEPKRRSRKGCWPCKGRKVKCGEEHPACRNCLKTGEVCDYSVRLNWQGRRTKRSVVDEDEEDGPVPKDNCIRWHHHGFSMEQIQVLGVPLEQRLDLDIIEPVDDGQKQDASTDLVSVVSNAICSGQPTVLTRSNLIFIDESQQLLSATANPEAHIVKRRLADSQSCSTASSSRSGSGMDSPVSSQRKRTRSLAQLEQLEPGPNPSLALYKQKQGPSSSVALLPCRDLFDAPLTPAASSPSDDVAHCRNWTELHSSGSPDSWSSSGNGESEDLFIPPGCLWDDSGPFSLQESPSYSEIHPLGSGAFYGYDQGVADEDVLRNNENRAVLQPLAAHRSGHGILDFAQGAKARRKRGTNGAINGSYYDNMVPVIIPWAFEPLPDIVKRNRTNLLYLHHFLNHSAQVLVPYHTEDTNPVTTRVAAMALENDALMSLLLAYSACHRSQLLQTSPPRMRMAEWAQSIFPALRESLVREWTPVSNTTLAMAVILVALEIMSPGAFGHGISWRGHITHARSLLAKRLERMSVKRVSGIAEGEGGEEEEEGFRFMQSWLGYVGIMGSLMASPMVDSVSSASELLPCSAFSVVPSRLGEELDNLGCMTGLSMRCVGLLGRVNDLSRQCDRERFGLDDRLWLGWSPTSSTAEQALVLEQNMIKSLAQTARPCSHGRAGNMHVRDVKEMATINEAFHWAGLIQLRRRVLGKPTNDADVQLHVRKILICLEKLRTGTAAEIRCLFPIFTAGCEAADKDQRRRLLSRLESAERSGMKQVYHARLLLERVWTEGRPWEELIGDEFIA